ncbi:MAG: sulfite exporter TauE/SafE family protein, partial [Lachnospiraceae bacterium]|nr:sulfite exporter TauE/SafE family protein [Lachnospiraceae bacterium]
VWIILNTIILVDDIRAGYWDSRLLITFLISIPFLFIGMRIGSRLYAKMNQRTFMIITYILLFISGLTLLFK